MSFKYHTVSAEEKAWDETDRSSSIDSLQPLAREESNCASQGRVGGNWVWLVHGALFLSSLTLFLSAVLIQSSTLKHVRDFSAYSPAATAVEYERVKFNVTTQENRFVGAGPEVDAAWDEISFDVGDQMLTPEQLARLDMPELADVSLKVTHPETGVEGYRVGMEVFHQLHCLNLLRMVTYKEHYEELGGDVGMGKEKLQMHTDHCIEVLRLNLQCTADIGIFTLYMVEDDPLAWPQLNSYHQCRNFDRIRDWAMDHTVGNMEVDASR